MKIQVSYDITNPTEEDYFGDGRIGWQTSLTLSIKPKLEQAYWNIQTRHQADITTATVSEGHELEFMTTQLSGYVAINTVAIQEFIKEVEPLIKTIVETHDDRSRGDTTGYGFGDYASAIQSLGIAFDKFDDGWVNKTKNVVDISTFLYDHLDSKSWFPYIKPVPFNLDDFIRLIEDGDYQIVESDDEEYRDALLTKFQDEKLPMTWIDLKEANLRETDLHNADLRETDLRSADLSGANLSGADLSNADLSRACLVQANLEETNLTGTDLQKANLEEADLIRADLTYTNLTDANLTRVDLRKADFTNADLTGADLTGADLSDAYIDDNTIFTNTIITNADLTNICDETILRITDEAKERGSK